ncbi:unnamed protein product [Nezara viridula]|uniref:SAM domain-containing protein n=1 Tax=Nezara viridula TaxID=85310 RepID=A0A9P0MV06_NEZVI|nr:unnamed protein product [Nezara viridula]
MTISTRATTNLGRLIRKTFLGPSFRRSLQNFREQRIDGSSLPLLTEDHLTTRLGMRLGPALRLRSLLSSRLGQCPSCLHCVHCHQPPDK